VDGEIRCKKGAGGSLLTTREFADCVLTFEFRLTPGANNGLAIRAPLTGNAAFDGLELQILDDSHPKYADLQPWQMHGSIYGVVPAARDCLKPAGEWNTEEVTVQGSKVKVVVNGKQILDADIAPYRDGKPTLDGKPHPGSPARRAALASSATATRCTSARSASGNSPQQRWNKLFLGASFKEIPLPTPQNTFPERERWPC
jgi:hypothetical protein